ncbi:nucleolar protein 12 [Colossoma macropomum]|uniref:nucleolar protein 12 n=1 Tax=Colossoma macropomum TaxID=42526 RepID=UPI0018655EE9|nr:nucleolar protein 12 [Colossoma macropomum]
MKKNKTKGMKTGFKAKPGVKRREYKRVVVFDDKERQDFLTGFHKRKMERRKTAIEEMKNKLKEEQKIVREERHKEYLRMLKERREALEEADELEDAIKATTESVQYDHPNHTVTVTTISDLDLTGTRLLEPLTSQEESDDGKKCDEEEKVAALPKKPGNPLLSKKIKSISSSLQAFTKQKKKRRKGKQDVRGSRHQVERNSLNVMGNKRRLGRSTKKQRRRRTGRKGQSQD